MQDRLLGLMLFAILFTGGIGIAGIAAANAEHETADTLDSVLLPIFGEIGIVVWLVAAAVLMGAIAVILR